jgi:hypothetical protein
MARGKRYQPEQVVNLLRQIEVAVANGKTTAQACKEAEIRRAVELNPGYAAAHHWYAWHLSLVGRTGEAIAEMKKAVDLDPVSPIVKC